MTTLYRLYDDQGALLYVGIAEKWTGRLGQHGADKPWFASVANVKVEHFATRGEAAAAEKQAIQTERPTHNVVHNRTRRPETVKPPSVGGRMHWTCDYCGKSLGDDDFIQSPRHGSREWVATCRRCDPDGDSTYWISTHRIQNRQEAMHWLEHLSGKAWFDEESWCDLLVRAAHLPKSAVEGMTRELWRSQDGRARMVHAR